VADARILAAYQVMADAKVPITPAKPHPRRRAGQAEDNPAQIPLSEIKPACRLFYVQEL
jgi:hypothetical protein